MGRKHVYGPKMFYVTKCTTVMLLFHKEIIENSCLESGIKQTILQYFVNLLLGTSGSSSELFLVKIRASMTNK